MPRKSELPKSRHHVMIYDEDWEFLRDNYDREVGVKRIGISEALCLILHAKITDMRRIAAEEYERQQTQQATAATQGRNSND